MRNGNGRCLKNSILIRTYYYIRALDDANCSLSKAASATMTYEKTLAYRGSTNKFLNVYTLKLKHRVYVIEIIGNFFLEVPIHRMRNDNG